MLCSVCLSDCWPAQPYALQSDNNLLVKYVELDTASSALAAREIVCGVICTDSNRPDNTLHPAESSVTGRNAIIVRHQLVIN